MARGRLISKSLGSSRKFDALNADAGKLAEFCQALYPLIIANTDDFGRMEGDAFTVKHLVWPSSPRPERDFDQALNALKSVGLINRYVVDGSHYLQVVQFDEHQPGLNKQKRTKSRFPDPVVDGSVNFTEIREMGVGREGKGREVEEEGKGTQKGRSAKSADGSAPEARRESDALFEEFWLAYPRREAKPRAQKAWQAVRPDRALTHRMLAAIERQRQSLQWQRDGGKYIPHPATWLNGQRWLDAQEIDIRPPVSETMQHNLRAADEAVLLIQQAEAAKGGFREH